jgi:plasmid stabilization system protein ParE
MPARFRVILSVRAAADLHSLHDHIQKDSPQNATAFTAELVKAIDSLERLPLRYPVYSGRRAPAQVRRMPVPPYLIYYRVSEPNSAVEIITVRHGAPTAASVLTTATHAIQACNCFRRFDGRGIRSVPQKTPSPCARDT